MRMTQLLVGEFSWQRGTLPPVTLERGTLCVVVEGDRVTGMAVGADAESAVRRAWDGGKVVEA